MYSSREVGTSVSLFSFSLVFGTWSYMSALARTHRTFSVSDLITVQSVIRDQVRRGARK